MSDNNDDRPLEFPDSDTDYYPEVEEDLKHRKPMQNWQPECLKIMQDHGFGPEDFESEEEYSEEEDEGQSIFSSQGAVLTS
jgi:hypothetical protein